MLYAQIESMGSVRVEDGKPWAAVQDRIQQIYDNDTILVRITRLDKGLSYVRPGQFEVELSNGGTEMVMLTEIEIDENPDAIGQSGYLALVNTLVKEVGQLLDSPEGRANLPGERRGRLAAAVMPLEDSSRP